MNRNIFRPGIGVLILWAAVSGNAADLTGWPKQFTPFTVEAGANATARFPGAPRLHSFAWAQWQGKWIFIAGRTGGYHGVGGSEADFSRSTADSRIWVTDPSGDGPARTYSIRVADLPASLGLVKQQWQSSNPVFFQDKDTLYIAGGYGQNAKGDWVTFPLISSVHLPELVDDVMHARTAFASTIAYAESPAAQTTGGEMLKLDDGFFYIAGGHVFTGTYSSFEATNEKDNPQASQTYLGEIRKLRVTRAGAHLSVELVERYGDPEFDRRDLNAGFRILPDGHTLGGAAYGGVFTKDQLGFTKPIYWDAASPPRADDAFEQKLSGYSCAHALLFDPDSGTMYTTFFGGISRWTWDYAKQQLSLVPLSADSGQPIYKDGLTWIDHISTLIQRGGDTQETIEVANRLPAYLGASAAFLPAADMPRLRADVPILDLRALRGKRTLIGYVFGGIRAFPKEFPFRDDSRPYRPGSVPTKASDMIVPIYVTVPK